MPSNGESNSKTKKMAPAPASAEITSAVAAVLFGGASRLKLANMTTSQDETTTSIGVEMELSEWATSNARSWAKSAAPASTNTLSFCCASVAGDNASLLK